MKRKIFAVLAVGAIALVSCKKEEPVAPSSPGSATIQGTLWSNTNLDNDTDQWGFYMYNPEYAKTGVTFSAVIDGMDLDQTPDGSFNYSDVVTTGTIGANGAYTVSVPCYSEWIDCEVRFNDYTDNQLSGGANDATKEYFGGSVWVSVYDGAVVIQDFTYSY